MLDLTWPIDICGLGGLSPTWLRSRATLHTEFQRGQETRHSAGVPQGSLSPVPLTPSCTLDVMLRDALCGSLSITVTPMRLVLLLFYPCTCTNTILHSVDVFSTSVGVFLYIIQC